jgi:hypothetical protein
MTKPLDCKSFASTPAYAYLVACKATSPALNRAPRSLVTALADYVAAPGLPVMEVTKRMALTVKLTGLRVIQGGKE